MAPIRSKENYVKKVSELLGLHYLGPMNTCNRASSCGLWGHAGCAAGEFFPALPQMATRKQG